MVNAFMREALPIEVGQRLEREHVVADLNQWVTTKCNAAEYMNRERTSSRPQTQ